jgi:hypothetical protein
MIVVEWYARTLMIWWEFVSSGVLKARLLQGPTAAKGMSAYWLFKQAMIQNKVPGHILYTG